MNIGVYGGTFNPPHLGHMAAAKAAMEQLQLDKLLLIPAATPPHKVLPAGSANALQRFEMAQLACAELGKKAEATDVELRREGRSFTSDTLLELRKAYPDDTLYLLMGSDMFLSFHNWHEPQTICDLAVLAPFSRYECAGTDEFTAQEEHLQRAFGARVQVVDNRNVIDLSSTQVRDVLDDGQGREMLPEAVYGYIQRQHLYGTTTDLKHLTVDELRSIAMSYLKPKRMPHVRGTEQVAAELARLHGVDEQEARIAALLHDCTKKLDMEEQLGLCREHGIVLDDLEQRALKLLHSRTGAEIARRIFSVSDAVYSAIRWHTTGHENMTTLEKIIYLADYIEPTRDFDGVEPLRRVVYEDLDKGMLLGLTMTIEEMEAMGNPVHHHTLDARNHLIKKGVTL